MSKQSYRQHIFSQIGYTPTAAQEPSHTSDARIKLIAGGERGGKSMTSSKEAVLSAANPTTGLIWLVGPDYDGAVEEFNYLGDDMGKLNLLKDISESHKGPLWMDLWNGKIGRAHV